MEALKYSENPAFGRLAFDESYIIGHKGYSLHQVMWMPEESPRAIIMIVHDIGDHILRYKNLADYFNTHGFGVVGIDLRGHGKSGGKRGCACYDDLLKDVNELVRQTHKLFPYIPKILYGNGLGGNLALQYAIKQKEPMQGLIAASPWIRSLRKPSSFFRFSSNLRIKALSFLTVSTKIHAKYLSHDLAIRKKYATDPLVHKRISPRLFMEVNKAGEIILRNRHKCNVPLLLMHGSSDKITSWRASAEFTKYTSDKTTFKLWEGDYHELHNELDKEKIFEYILQWIKSTSSTQRVIYGNF